MSGRELREFEKKLRLQDIARKICLNNKNNKPEYKLSEVQKIAKELNIPIKKANRLKNTNELCIDIAKDFNQYVIDMARLTQHN